VRAMSFPLSLQLAWIVMRRGGGAGLFGEVCAESLALEGTLSLATRLACRLEGCISRDLHVVATRVQQAVRPEKETNVSHRPLQAMSSGLRAERIHSRARLLCLRHNTPSHMNHYMHEVSRIKGKSYAREGPWP